MGQRAPTKSIVAVSHLREAVHSHERFEFLSDVVGTEEKEEGGVKLSSKGKIGNS